MRRTALVCFLLFGLLVGWTIVHANDFYVIPVKKCCTCKGTLSENRWCNNHDGTVTDMNTCLVWLKYANWGGTKKWRCSDDDPDKYDDAHKRAGLLCDGAVLFESSGWQITLNDGSVEGDWRLPTKSELLELFDGTPPIICHPGPCSMYGFSGIQDACYWSSSTRIAATATAYVVCAHHEPIWATYYKNSATFYVWPVRDAK